MTLRNLLIAFASATFALASTAVAQKASVPKRPDKAALASPHVQELLLVMDTDKDGKISNEEWMKSMETEFDRLDRTRAGSSINLPSRG
jgi:hypothetical protein